MKIKLLLMGTAAIMLLSSCLGVMGLPAMQMELIATSYKDMKPGNAEEQIENQDIIEIDTIAFEMNDRLEIRQKMGKEIAEYQRITNPNYSVPSAKLFSTKGRELFTLVPSADKFGIHIYIKDSTSRRGAIDITGRPEINGFTSVRMNYTIKTDFFDKPYSFHFYEKTIATAGMSPDQKTTGQYILFENEVPVLAFISTLDMSNPDMNKNNIIVDHDFLSKNTNDVAAWCTIFVLIQDVNEQLADEARKNNMHRNNDFYDDGDRYNPEPRKKNNNFPTPSPGRTFNNNGSIDNNHNPFDNF